MPLEKRVITLVKSKKIVLFIVEGITDQISLGLVLSKIIQKDKIVKFKVIHGDITTDKGTQSNNIAIKITDKIKDFIGKDVYKKSDIQNVVHLIDTDGVYIDEALIIQKNIRGVEYDTHHMYARNIENIKERNEQKTDVLNKLIKTDKVYKDLPYRIYFFSCNLEHVLHNNEGVLDHDKIKNAQRFEDRFEEEPYGFIEFMNSPEFAVKGNYTATWDFIKEDTHSLNRYSNFHLYLNVTIHS